MGTVARGHKLYLQLGKQTVAGTPVAATGVRLELINFTLDPVQGSAEDPSLIDGILSPRNIFQFGRYYGGTMSGRLGYLGLLKLYEMIMGDGTSPATPAVSVADGNGIITYTFKQGFTLPFHTAEVLEGGYDALTTVAQYTDFVIESLRVTAEAVQSGEAGIFRFEATIAAKSRAIGITAAALTLVTSPETPTFKQAGTMVDGLGDAGADFEVKGFTINVSQPLDKERYQLGTVVPNTATRAGRQSIEWTLVLGWQKNSQVAALEAWTDAAPHILMTGTELVGAAGVRSIDFASTKTKVVGVSRPIDRFGTIYQTVRYQAYYDSAVNTGLTIIAKNESVTIAAG